MTDIEKLLESAFEDTMNPDIETHALELIVVAHLAMADLVGYTRSQNPDAFNVPVPVVTFSIHGCHYMATPNVVDFIANHCQMTEDQRTYFLVKYSAGDDENDG